MWKASECLCGVAQETSTTAFWGGGGVVVGGGGGCLSVSLYKPFSGQTLFHTG